MQIIVRTRFEAACAAMLSPPSRHSAPDSRIKVLLSSPQVHPGPQSMGQPWCSWVIMNEEQPTFIFCRDTYILFTVMKNLSCPMPCSRHSLARCWAGISYDRTSELQHYSTQCLTLWQEKESRF